MYPEYQGLLAPFYFKTADSLISYIECNMNEMNQLKPLELPDDPDDINDEDVDDPNEEEKVPEGSPNLDDDDDEPKIEDVIDSKIEKKEEGINEVVPAENAEFEELS